MLSIITMFHCAYHLCHCDPTMRVLIVKNKVKCFACMWKQFLIEKREKPILHKGCAVCSKHGDSEGCPKEMFNTVLILTVILIVHVL